MVAQSPALETHDTSVSRGQVTTPGTTSPTLCDQYVGSFTSRKVIMNKGCERGPRFIIHPRRLESLPFACVIIKATLSPQLFKDPEL